MAESAKRKSGAGRGLINLRISEADRNVIDHAARSAGKTRTEFVVEAARRAAHETLLDTTLVLVDGATFSRFKEMFDAPPDPPEGLRQLMSRKAPWEE